MKNERRSEAVKKVWAARSLEARLALARKISAANKGKKRSASDSAAKSEAMKAQWAAESPTSQRRRAGIEKAIEAARGSSAKRKRAESLKAWREANPGIPGSAGLTVSQRVRLFFAAHPTASDEECARAIGRTVYMVAKHRDPRSKTPYKRQLLHRLVSRETVSACLSFLLGRLPKCPECGETADSIHWDEARFGGRWVGHHDRCQRHFVLPKGSRPERPRIKNVTRERLATWLDSIAAGKSIQRANKEAGMGSSQGEKVAVTLLVEVGGHDPREWRRSNRFRGTPK